MDATNVTRPGKFGNPFKSYDAEIAVRHFREWLDGKRYNVTATEERRQKLLNSLPELWDRDVACFCKEDAEWCHGDVLIEFAEASKPKPEYKTLGNIPAQLPF